MKKSEQVLQELHASMPEYIKSVASFQFEGENYILVDHYRSDAYLVCEICGHERILDVYVVMDSRGKKLIVGNVCIDKISNQKIRKWFASYKQKTDNIQKNRELIDQVSKILEDCENGEAPIYISKIGIERPEKLLDRMCSGLDPLEKTEISTLLHKQDRSEMSWKLK